MHEEIRHNLLTLLECGAFGTIAGEQATSHNTEKAITAMSPHKWRTLIKAAEELEVLPFVAHGAEMLRSCKNLSPTLLAILEDPNKPLDIRSFDVSKAQLYNHWTAKRLEEVHEEEMNSPQLSEETLNLLDIILANADEIITRDVSILGIVWLGYYIRQYRKAIDFTKLEQWLQYIGMVRIATLEGSMLLDCMHFQPDELPFVKKRNKKAEGLFMNSLAKVFQKHSCSTSARMDVAMIETLSYRITTTITRITDIEE